LTIEFFAQQPNIPAATYEQIWLAVDFTPETWRHRLPVWLEGTWDGNDDDEQMEKRIGQLLGEVADEHEQWRKTELQSRENAGRPVGTGTFNDREDFKRAVGKAIDGLGRKRARATEQEVSEYFDNHTNFPTWDTDGRQLSRWLKQHGYTSWQALLTEIAGPI
jgi:hypothetical protein